MASQTMKVGAVISQGGQFNLIGDGANPQLNGMTVTLDSNPPPGFDLARGSYTPPYANVFAGQGTWNALLTRVGSLPFRATLVYQGSTVQDLNFANALAAAGPRATREDDVAPSREDDVAALREDVQQIHALLARLLDERSTQEQNGAGTRPSDPYQSNVEARG